MIVGFTGTQKGMTAAQRVAVKSLLVALMPDLVLHGGCVGADMDFDDIVEGFMIETEAYPSNILSKRGQLKRHRTTIHDALPPLIRNGIIAARCKVLIATPGEDTEQLRSGTWATVRYARVKNKTIYLIFPDGKVTEELR